VIVVGMERPAAALHLALRHTARGLLRPNGLHGICLGELTEQRYIELASLVEFYEQGSRMGVASEHEPGTARVTSDLAELHIGIDRRCGIYRGPRELGRRDEAFQPVGPASSRNSLAEICPGAEPLLSQSVAQDRSRC
jgi:hypothetical protein